MSARFAGLDIGGTKIAAGLVSADGRLLRSDRVPTPRTGADTVLAAAADLATRVMAGETVAGVGVGAPGVIDRVAGTVLSATDVLPGWAGAPVRPALERRLGRPVTVDNDVRAMALGEVRAGAARGHADVLFVSVGTGIGGALAHHGRLRRGPHGTAGEVGHLLAGQTGPIACGCGRTDHVEAVASGPAIAAGGPDALPRAAAVLGRALAGLVTALDVDAVVIGGGVAQAGAAFLTPLERALRAEVLPPLRAIPILGAALGADAPIVGAALLAADALEETTR
ncbi:ROK family protein [Dactylosporangium sp. CS-047395]|uniref:ROK family protein n=1 Tax=Dactylosporangium sp. CS-047395 TaxID=3239936 RepID=UPI003D8B385E